MPPKKCHQRGILLHRGRGSTAHAQTSPCYSIGAFIKCASKSLFATKKCHQSPFCHKKMPPEPFLPPKNATRALSATKKCHQRGILLHRGEGVYCACADFPMLQHRSFHQMCIKEPFCHQKMPPEPFLPPKNATRALSATKKCHQRGILLHMGEGVYCACADFPMLQHRSFHQMCIKEPFCHQKMPPEPFLPPKNATRALSAPKKCHQSPFCHQKMPPERNSAT